MNDLNVAKYSASSSCFIDTAGPGADGPASFSNEGSIEALGAIEYGKSMKYVQVVVTKFIPSRAT